MVEAVFHCTVFVFNVSHGFKRKDRHKKKKNYKLSMYLNHNRTEVAGL